MAKGWKRVLKEGSGPPPGYCWSVEVLEAAVREEEDLLEPPERAHIRHCLKDLAMTSNPSHCKTQSIKPVEDYHELREKSAAVRGRNIRVFFGIDKARRTLVVLGIIDKKNDGATPVDIKARMRFRWRRYRRITDTP